MVRPEYDEVVSGLRGAGCVFAEEEADILVESASDSDDLAALLARRIAGGTARTHRRLGVVLWSTRRRRTGGIRTPSEN